MLSPDSGSPGTVSPVKEPWKVGLASLTIISMASGPCATRPAHFLRSHFCAEPVNIQAGPQKASDRVNPSSLGTIQLQPCRPAGSAGGLSRHQTTSLNALWPALDLGHALERKHPRPHCVSSQGMCRSPQGRVVGAGIQVGSGQPLKPVPRMYH